jgi:hypothetical protein
MKLAHALKIIKGPSGYCVHFEHAGDGLLRSDHFPEVRNGEAPISTEDEAWELAGMFADATRGKCVNLYVVNADNFVPVMGYRDRYIYNR